MNATNKKLVVLDKKKTNARKPRAKPRAGAAKMREAADKVARRDCKPLIEALSTKGKGGQLLSVKLLYDLAHTAEESGETQGPGEVRNLALELANSPEWKGGPPETSMDDEDESTDE